MTTPFDYLRYDRGPVPLPYSFGVTGITPILVAPLGPLALDARIAFLGDSNTEFGHGGSDPTRAMDIRSHVPWTNVGLSAKLFEPATTLTEVAPRRGGNLGKGGEVSSTVAARAGDAKLINAAIVVYGAGTNDMLGTPVAATIKAADDLVVSTCRANGQRLVMWTIPVANGTAAWSAPYEVIRQVANNYRKSLAARDVLVFDSDSVLTSAQILTNDVHFTNAGGKALGFGLAQKIIDAGWAPIAAATTLYTDATCFTTALVLAGTGGGHIGGFSSGVVADNCFADADSAGHGATIVASKDGSDRQVLTFGGTETGTTGYAEIFNNETTDLPTTATVGEGFLDFEITVPLSNIVSIDGVFDIQTTGFSGILRLDTAGATNQSAFPLSVGRYQMRTVPCLIPAGTIGRVISRCRALLTDGTSLAVSGEIKIHKMGLRVVP